MRWLLVRAWLLLLCSVVGCSSLNPAFRLRKSAAEPVLSLDRGDFGYLHPLQPLNPSIEQMALAVPQEVKDHTYLFFINGWDPYYFANFRGQCQHMKTLGYNNAYCGQTGHTGLFRQTIQRFARDDPSARIVVIGYSSGANYARSLANQLKQDGVRIDLLVYLSGDTIKDVDRSRPDNVGRILNITGHGSVFYGYDLLFCGQDIKGASNHRLDARHFMLPTRAEAMELLVQYVVEMNRQPLPSPTSRSAHDGAWR